MGFCHDSLEVTRCGGGVWPQDIAVVLERGSADNGVAFGPRRTCRKAPAGLFFCAGTTVNRHPLFAEPAQKRAITFVDGQNLFHCAQECFGYHYPNYDVLKLAQTVCAANRWQLSEARFYTGFPDAMDDPFWNAFWTKKLLAISRQGVRKFSRGLRYRNRVIKIGDGVTIERRLGEEKGVDVRIAIDLIRLGHRNAYDVAVVFSQDQDLSEAVKEIRQISQEQRRWIKVVSAFPWRDGCPNERGIDGTDWFKIGRDMYDGCIDPFDYRAPRQQGVPPN